MKYFGIPTISSFNSKAAAAAINASSRNYFINASQLFQHVVSTSNNLQQMRSTNLEATFDELNVNGKVLLGGCSAWRSFLYGQALLNQYYYSPTTIDLISFLGKASNGISNYALNTSHKSCMATEKVGQIVSRLTSLSVNTLVSVNCSANLWVINTCNSIPKLCINCQNPCDETVHNILASCSNITHNQVNGFVLLVGFSIVGSAAPAISFVGFSSTNSSITVRVGLSKNGMVFCGAYSKFQSQPSTVQQVIQQGFYGNVSDTLVGVTITGLQSMSTYLVYCASVSLTGSVTNFADMTKNILSITTKCCKLISVWLSTDNAVTNNGIQNFISLTISDPPSISANILISMNISEKSGIIVPNEFYLNRSSTTQSTVLYASMNTFISPGSYVISVSVNGLSANEYSVKYLSNTVLTVFSTMNTSRIACPKLASVSYSSDGSYLQASFDSNTNKASLPDQFPCSYIFDFSCADLATCVWISHSIVQIYFQSNLNASCAIPGHSFQMKTNVSIQSQYSSRLCSAKQTSAITIGFPIGPLIPPTVVISAPSIIDTCSTLILSVADSVGHSGRNWSSVSITVTSINDDVRALQEFLTQRFEVFSPPPIPPYYFQVGGKYTFFVTLCNFLNSCGVASKNILVVSSVSAKVSFPGSSYRDVYRYTELWLQPIISPSNCSSIAKRNYKYSWTVYLNGVRTYALSSYLTSTNPDLYIPAYSLAVNCVYQVDLTVSQSTIAAEMSSTATIYLNVLAGDVFAVLQEGLNQSLTALATLKLDATHSFDQDVQSLTGTNAGLKFQWACMQTSPIYSDSCNSLLTMTFDNPAVVIIQAKDNRIEQSAELQLTVQNSAGTKFSKLIVSVTVTNSSASSATLVSSSKTGVLVPYDYLQLQGDIRLAAGQSCNATWSVDRESEGLALSRIANCPVFTFLPAKNTSTDHRIFLIVPPHSFNIFGVLKFSLSCALASNANSDYISASVSLTINTPPLLGSFYSLPSSGRAYSVLFNFIAPYWFDTDLPISYEFGYYSALSGNNFIALRSRAEVSCASLYLPAGLSRLNYIVDGGVHIYDSLLSNSTALFPITVFPMEGTVNVSMILQQELELSLNTADFALRSFSFHAAVVNSVPCDLAPNCSLLNRGECLKTAHTCGSCVSGYIGDDGDSNNPCFSSERTQKSGNDSFSNSKRRLLQGNQKACPANCSAHGRCAFVSVDTDSEISNCPIDEFTCQAVCICDLEYRGTSACYLSSIQLQQQMSYRGNAIAAVQTFLLSQHLNVNNINTIITELLVATQVFEELSLSSCEQGFSILESILISYDQLGLEA